MKIPEGYVLVKLSEIPGMIRDSVRTVMKQKKVMFCPCFIPPDDALTNAILAEMGNNAAQPIALSGEAASAEEADRMRGALDYLRRKIDGYDTVFEHAEAQAMNTPCHDCSRTYTRCATCAPATAQPQHITGGTT